jgi:hypothetical protein
MAEPITLQALLIYFAAVLAVVPTVYVVSLAVVVCLWILVISLWLVIAGVVLVYVTLDLLLIAFITGCFKGCFKAIPSIYKHCNEANEEADFVFDESIWSLTSLTLDEVQRCLVRQYSASFRRAIYAFSELKSVFANSSSESNSNSTVHRTYPTARHEVFGDVRYLRYAFK